MDLGSTDETAYGNSDTLDKTIFQLHVNPHVVNNESVSQVTKNEMEVASNVNFKIQVIRGSDRLVEIPENAVSQ